MTELTPQVRKLYEDLKNAFDKHNTERDSDNTIQKILPSLKSKKTPKTLGELQQEIDLLELYVKIKRDLLRTELFVVSHLYPNPSSQAEKEKVERDFFDSLEKLKNSLKPVEDEDFDLTQKIEDKCPVSVILDSLDSGNLDLQKEQTAALLDDRDPKLEDEKQIEELTEAWTTAVNDFVDDARKEPIPTQKTLANFFCIHNELEIIYSRLADTEILQRIS